MLARWGIQPSVVASGTTALIEMLRASHTRTPFSLVLLDRMLPDADGFTVAVKIREYPELSRAAVMMLSFPQPEGPRLRADEEVVWIPLTCH
jgi:DNA-binding response OmpR family regulator